MTSLELKPGQGFAVGEPRTLFAPGQYVLAGNGGADDVSPDGKRFVMVRLAPGAGEIEPVVVQNWFEELNARVGK